MICDHSLCEFARQARVIVVLEKIIGLVTAVVTFTAAIYAAHLSIRGKTTGKRLIRSRWAPLSVERGSENSSKSLKCRLFRMSLNYLPFIALYLAIGIYELRANGGIFSLTLGIFLLTVAYILSVAVAPYLRALAAVLRAENKTGQEPEPSATAKATVASADYAAVQAVCVAALKEIGATIHELCADQGCIKATKGSRLRRQFENQEFGFGDDIKVNIKSAEDRMSIEITSRGIRPGWQRDVKRHRENVRLFIDRLIN